MKVLFVCVENSCRSQIAEGFARALGGEGVVAASAGSAPSGVVNPKAVASMARAGIDISGHKSQGTAVFEKETWDYAITMGCGDRCPALPAARREDWPVPDPKHLDEAEFDAIREDIRRRVQDLLGRGR